MDALIIAIRILGVIFTALGSIIAIDTLWKRKIQDGITYIENTKVKFASFILFIIFMTILYAIFYRSNYSTFNPPFHVTEKKEEEENKRRKISQFRICGIGYLGYLLG